MEFTHQRTTQFVAILLILAAITQATYTALYLSEADVPRQFLWGTEGLLFTLLAAFAGSALVDSKRYSLGFSAIAMSAVLNVVQVGVGLTMFGPFGESAGALEGAGVNKDAAGLMVGAVVAYSFMVYNAAKILLGLAAIVFGMAVMNKGGKALGGLTALVGIVAMTANTLSMAAGRDVTGELPLAGGSGVLATLLLAVCLFSVAKSTD